MLFYAENCNESRTGEEGNATEEEQEITANLPVFYGAVLSAESWFVIFFIDIHHLAKAIKPNRSLQSLLRVVILIAIVFMSQFYIDFQRTRYVLKMFPHCVS